MHHNNIKLNHPMTFLYFKKQSSFILFIGMIFFCLSTQAATITWNKTGAGTYDFSDGTNWAGGVAPGSTDDAVFPNAVANQTINFTGNTTVNSIKMPNTASPTYKYTLSLQGYTLTISSFAEFTQVLTTSTGSIVVNSTSTTVGYITIANSTFNSGYTLNLSCARNALNRAVNIQSSSFGGSFTCTTKRFLLQTNTFSSDFTFTKTDASANNTTTTNYDDINGCTFNSTSTIINADNKSLYLTSNTYVGAATITNNSAALSVLIGGTNTYSSTVSISNTTAGGVTVGGTNTFNGAVNFTNSSSGALVVSNVLTDVSNFNSASTPLNVYFNNTGTGYIRISDQGEINFYNSNVVIGSTSTGSIRIGYATSSTKMVTVSSTSSITVYPDNIASSGAPYFSNGSLYIDRLDIQASTTLPVSFSLGLNATIQFVCNTSNLTKIRRAFDAKFYRCYYIAGEFFKATTFTLLNGIGTSVSTLTCDALTFDSDVTFNNESSFAWLWGGNGTAVYNTYFKSTGSTRSIVTVQNKGLGIFYFSFYQGTHNFNNVDLRFVRLTSAALVDPGDIFVCYSNALAIITMDAYSTLNIIQDAGEVVSTATKGVTLGKGSSPTPNFIIYGKLKIKDITKGSLLFGGGFIAKAVANPTSIGLTDDVNLAEVTDDFVSTAYRYIYYGTYGSGPVFEKKVSMTFWEIGDYEVTFKEDVYIRMLKSPGIRVWIIATFEKDAVFQFDANSAMRLGYALGCRLDFRGNVTLINYSAGLSFAENGTACTIKGNLTWLGTQGHYIGYSAGPGVYGTTTFNGTSDQSITTGPATATTMPNGTVEAAAAAVSTLGFYHLEIDKNSGVLKTLNNVYINNSHGGYNTVTTRPRLKLTKGNIISTSSGFITIADNSVCEGGSLTSFVDGPLAKVGDDNFTFAIGKGTRYFPLAITTPSLVAAVFKAEFFYGMQPNAISLTGTLKDALNCQYWTLDKSGTTSTVTTTVGLSWNNDPSQICYPVNHDLVCVGRFNGTNWVNEGANVLSDIQPADYGIIGSSSISNFGYFTLGYRNALVLNTCLTNPTKFKVYNNVEKMNLTYTSGSSGTPAGTSTMLSQTKNINGNIVVHPTFNTTFDVNIDRQLTGTPTDVKAGYINYTPLNVKVHAAVTGSTNVVDYVNIDEDGDNTFLPLLPDNYQTTGNTLFFYKEKQNTNTFELTNNLTDALTFTVNRYITTPSVPFQIISAVPTGYSATLRVYTISSTLVATNTTDLTWNGKIDVTTFYPEGVYPYVLELSNGTITKSYKGQMILKHQ
jgi:hypothetical protein